MNRRFLILEGISSGLNTSPKIADSLKVEKKHIQNDLYNLEKNGYIRCTHTIKVATGNPIKVYERTNKEYIDPNKLRGRGRPMAEMSARFSTCKALESFVQKYAVNHSPIPAMTGL